MSNYANRFKKLLTEKDEDVPGVDVTDKDAMVQTLDKGTDPNDFNVDAPAAGSQVEPTMSAIQRKMYDELKGWVLELDTMSRFLNGTGPESMQSRLNSAEPETLFDKISAAETKKIARVAVEISSLSEMLKGYLATANDPKYKYN